MWMQSASRAAFRMMVIAAAPAMFLCAATTASAGGLFSNFEETRPFPSIDEVRFGLLMQDIEESNSEEGLTLNGEVLFGRLGHERGDYLLDHFLRPRPHLGVSLNTNGDTNQAYFGVTWDTKITDWLFFESSFGGALHDGPHDDGKKADFGCTLNFRESASLGFALSERWRMLLTIDHMSNAGLCDANDGLTSGGIRFGYKW